MQLERGKKTTKETKKLKDIMVRRTQRSITLVKQHGSNATCFDWFALERSKLEANENYWELDRLP